MMSRVLMITAAVVALAACQRPYNPYSGAANPGYSNPSYGSGYSNPSYGSGYGSSARARSAMAAPAASRPIRCTKTGPAAAITARGAVTPRVIDRLRAAPAQTGAA